MVWVDIPSMGGASQLGAQAPAAKGVVRQLGLEPVNNDRRYYF